jgi:hypothetical protein
MSVDPAEAVALGAAIHAGVLLGHSPRHPLPKFTPPTPPPIHPPTRRTPLPTDPPLQVSGVELMDGCYSADVHDRATGFSGWQP